MSHMLGSWSTYMLSVALATHPVLMMRQKILVHSNLLGKLSCRQTDGEQCEPFTEVYRVKFQHVDNARFAKRKVDEFAFYGNLLQVYYAPQFETLFDTKDKLEGRRKEVLSRIRQENNASCQQMNLKLRKYPDSVASNNLNNHFPSHISSDKDYFSSASMNKTVRAVREKLDMIASSCESSTGPVQKKSRTDNRRRI